MTSIPKKTNDDYALPHFCVKFMKRFKISHLLRQTNAVKKKGISAFHLFACLIGLVFSGKNLYATLLVC